jgi:micrococcal nuclease
MLVAYLLFFSTHTTPRTDDVFTNHASSSKNEVVSATTTPYSTSTALAYVTRVIDGDTIEVSIDGKKERVRYIGIDTPESVHPTQPVECYGTEATAFNTSLVAGKYVRLESDITDRDRYGRLLRYVYHEGVMVNQQLVANGYAHLYTYPPDVAHVDILRRAQQEAREQMRGLWSACTSVLGQSAVPSESSVLPTCSIKGNISGDGEKIYHTPECPYYSRTHIDLSVGERWFCGEEEAQKEGWRRAYNCP